MQRPWRGAAYWLALPFHPACSDCYLILRTTSPGMIPPKMGWAFPHQSLIKTILYKFACSIVLWKHFLNWGSLLLDDSSLCQVNIKLTSTPENTQLLGSKGKDSQKEVKKLVAKYLWLQNLSALSSKKRDQIIGDTQDNVYKTLKGPVNHQWYLQPGHKFMG